MARGSAPFDKIFPFFCHNFFCRSILFYWTCYTPAFDSYFFLLLISGFEKATARNRRVRRLTQFNSPSHAPGYVPLDGCSSDSNTEEKICFCVSLRFCGFFPTFCNFCRQGRKFPNPLRATPDTGPSDVDSGGGTSAGLAKKWKKYPGAVYKFTRPHTIRGKAMAWSNEYHTVAQDVAQYPACLWWMGGGRTHFLLTLVV